MKKKFKVLFCILATAFIIAGTYFIFDSGKLTLKDVDMYSIVGNASQRYSGTVKLSQQDGQAKLSCDAVDLTLNATPLYYRNHKKILLPQVMEIVFYQEENVMKKLNYFSTIEQVDQSFKIEDHSYQAKKSDFFLFDGKDTYIFFEKTTIQFGEKSITIPAFSYVTNIYNNKLVVYHYESGEYNEYPIFYTDVMAQLSNNSTINLNTDTLKVNDQQILLIQQVEELKNLE